MTKTPVTDQDIHQLELSIANLEVEISDKKQQLAELKLERLTQVAQGPSVRAARSSPSQNKRRAASSPNSHSSSPRPRPSTFGITHQRVNTGFLDGSDIPVPIYVGDIVVLTSSSTGQFALRKEYRKGHRVEVFGTHGDYILIRYPGKPSVKTTSRLPQNVRKLIH